MTITMPTPLPTHGVSTGHRIEQHRVGPSTLHQAKGTSPTALYQTLGALHARDPNARGASAPRHHDAVPALGSPSAGNRRQSQRSSRTVTSALPEYPPSAPPTSLMQAPAPPCAAPTTRDPYATSMNQPSLPARPLLLAKGSQSSEAAE